MVRMRAKFKVDAINASTSTDGSVSSESISMSPVFADNYGPNGENEDNDFARYTPSGNLQMVITNPALFDTMVVGEKYYLDFTKAD